MNHFISQLKKGKYHFLGIAGILYLWTEYDKRRLKNHVFGIDGNGGEMLKIYSYLTDQEIASLRFQKRHSWHATKLEKDAFKNTESRINDEELKDLGIKFPEDRYVEYNKRPPHDFYL